MTKPTPRLVAFTVIGTLLGVVATVVAIPLAGHGDGWGIGNRFTPMLYPFATLLFVFPGAMDVVPGAFVVALVMAVCQFPIYGLLLGDAAATGWRRLVLTAMRVSLAHAVAAGICGLLVSWT